MLPRRLNYTLLVLAACVPPAEATDTGGGDSTSTSAGDDGMTTLPTTITTTGTSADGGGTGDASGATTAATSADTTGGGSDTGDTGNGTGAPSYPVVINEVVHDSSVTEDWVELFNNGDAAVDVSGWVINDSNDPTGGFAIPDGTSIDPAGYLVYVRNDPGSFTFGFSSDEEADLFDAEGNFVDVADWAQGQAADPLSWGRFPNGTGDFEELMPTQGAENLEPVAADVVINEIVLDPVVGGDWIELYNPGGSEIDVSGWIISDNISDSSGGFVIPDGTTIAGDAYLVYVRNDPGSFTFGFASDEEAALFEADGTTVHDSTDWAAGDGAAPGSWGRLPNGTGSFQTLATPTQGAENM